MTLEHFCLLLFILMALMCVAFLFARFGTALSKVSGWGAVSLFVVLSFITPFSDEGKCQCPAQQTK